MKDYYDVKAVSNSSLSWFKDSPKIFKLKFDGELEEPAQSYFEKGQQIHMYILEPEEFDKEYTFLNYERPKSAQQKLFCETFARKKKGSVNEKLLEAYKKAYATKESDEKVLEKAKQLKKQYEEFIKFIKISHVYTKVLPTSMLDQFNRIKINLRDHRKARELLFNDEHNVFGNSDKLFIKNEFPIYWKYPNGLECKSLIDRIIIDYEKKKVTLVDLKTTFHLYKFKEKVDEYSYHRQLAFYWMAIYWYFSNELKISLDDWEKETYIVAVGTNEPYEVKVFLVRSTKLDEGANEIMPLMDTLKWHFDNNLWEYDVKYYNNILVETI